MTITRSILAASTACRAIPVAAAGSALVEGRPMAENELPLEDTFGDIVGKAMRGTGVNAAQLAKATGIPSDTIARWLKDDGLADDGQARALATVLHLDGAKLADAAAQ